MKTFLFFWKSMLMLFFTIRVQRLTQSTPRHHGVQVRQQQCLDVAKHGLAVLLAVPSLTPDCYNPRNQSAGGIILSARISSHSR